AGFPGSKIDETQAARRIADHLGCEHVVLPIEPQSAAEILPAVQRAFDEPSAANSAIPLWFLSRTAAQHVKVVLCGEGGDELFMGYKRQRTARAMQRWGAAVRAVGGLGFVGDLPELPSRKLNYLRQRLERLRDSALLDNGYEQFFAAVTITSPALRARLYNHDFWLRQDAPHSLRHLVEEYFPTPDPALSPIEQFTMGDLAVHMPASLLNRLDRSSMAHSLEARVPFLSHSFVDWALTIPTGLKLRGKVGKYVLRQAVEPWLPSGALNQPKLGFQLPLADWFTGDFNDFAREVWRSSGAADASYLDQSAVEQLFDEHRAGRFNHGRVLYAIAMFSCWWKDQRPDAAASTPSAAASAGL
ncbi:MAG: asparagine synthase C-terminal domain-containing protein, partial [Sphingomicrobium sp.]